MTKFLLASLFCLVLLSPSVVGSPIPAEILYREPTIGLTDISPDGKYISYMANRQDQQYLAIQDTQDLTIQGVLVIESDQRLQDYAWLDSDTLLVNVRIGRFDRLVVVYRDKSSETLKWKNRLLKQEGYLVGRLRNKENQILLALESQQEGTNLDLYLLPVSELTLGSITDSYKLPEKQPGTRLFAYSEELKRLLVMTVNIDDASIDMEFRNLNNNDVEHNYRLKAEDFEFSPVGFLSTSKMAVLSNKDVETTSLYEFDLETQSLGKLLYQHKKYDLTGAEISGVTGEVISVNYFDHGRLATEYFSSAESNINQYLQKQLPDKQFTIAAQNLETQQKVIYAFASNDPGQYYLLDERTEKLTPLLARHPRLQGRTLATNEQINVVSQDGTEIEAYLTLPVGINHHTLLVMPHGGPIGIREYDEFDPTVQYFASRGFTILRVNFRGSAGFGKEFQESGVGQFGKLIEEDISAAVDQVDKKYQFKKRCAMGASYGGYSSMMLAIKHPKEYDCVVGSVGVYDLPLLFNKSNTSAIEEVRLRTENVVGKESDELYEFSPVYLADKIEVPVLLLAGLQDKIAPPEHTYRMELALKKMGKNVQSVYYKNSGHGHPTWYGDWHEATLTYQFLLDSLGLPNLSKGQIEEQDLDMIGEEYLRVGFGFDSAEGFEEDQERAFKFYTLAQNLGSARANTRLAWYYEDGILRDKDFAKAVELYEAGSNLGDDLAPYLLGRSYFKGEWLNKDDKKSLHYLELAIERGYNAAASVMAAYFYCLGKSVGIDETKCIDLMDLESMEKDDALKSQVNRSSFNTRRIILANVLLSPDLSNSIREKLIEAIVPWYEINTFDLEVDEKDYGVVTWEDEQFEYDGEDEITFDENTSLGVLFKMDFESDSPAERSMVVVQWKAKQANGEQSTIYETLLWGTERTNAFPHVNLSQIPDDATSLTLYISTVYNKPLYQKSFKLMH